MKNNDKINLYWYRGRSNLGDILSPMIVEMLSQRDVRWLDSIGGSDTFWRIFRKCLYFAIKLKWKKLVIYIASPYRKKMLAIGSVIRHSDKRTNVWGAGIMTRYEKIKGGFFFAVRGYKTIERLQELGLAAPPVVGDPALLLRRLITQKKEPVYEYGLIPHIVDYDDCVEKYKHLPIQFINMGDTDVHKTLSQIVKCKRIFSSSLHGLIIAHTYGIPALWCQFSDKIGGDNIKFLDYFSSVNLIEYKPLRDLYDENSFEQLFENNKQYALPENEIIEKRCDELLISFKEMMKIY
jgi:hypothetical protein